MLQRIRDAKKNQSGFTLIELLIVIVILGILAAVVVFAVSAFNNNGKAAACQSDFKNVEIADEAYYAKNRCTHVPGRPGGESGSLVPTYLKEAPSTTNGYTINLDARRGHRPPFAGSTATDITACGAYWADRVGRPVSAVTGRPTTVRLTRRVGRQLVGGTEMRHVIGQRVDSYLNALWEAAGQRPAAHRRRAAVAARPRRALRPSTSPR